MTSENEVLDALLGLAVAKTSKAIGDQLANSPPHEWAGEHVWQEPGETGHPMTGYADALAMFEHLQLPDGSVFCELGSGFGRLGLIIGLLYPRLIYRGYELVAPRVEAAQQAHAQLNLGDHVQFQVSDLSAWSALAADDADVYYVFCSFSEETGKHVLEELRKVAKRKTIQLVLNIGMYGFEPCETPWLKRREDFGIFTHYISD